MAFKKVKKAEAKSVKKESKIILDLKSIGVKVYPTTGNWIADVSLNIGNLVIIRGIKFCESKDNKLYLSFPSYKKKDGEYYDYVYALSKEARTILTAMAYDECLSEGILEPTEEEDTAVWEQFKPF